MSIGWITYAGSTGWIGEDGVASLHALTLNTSSVAENTAAGVLVGTLQGVTVGSTLSLTDTAGNRFALDGSTIETGATSTNFEAANSHNITVRETLDGYPNSPRDSVISITVTNVFEAASLNALTLDTDEVEEGAAAGTLVGTLQDVTSGSTLSLTDDADGRFVLDGEDVETGAMATDYDVATSHNITVRETLADSANSPRSSVIAITITEAPSAPAQFGSGNWSVADAATSNDIVITITALPDDGNSALTDLEYQLDGGSWVSLAGTSTGAYPVAGLTNYQAYSVAIRAVNAIGNGTASATKAVTPTMTPANLTPLAWYDPSDLSTMWTDDGVTPVTTDGDIVYRIDDKSGNGLHMKQTTLANRPLYKTSGGLHWLLFDGANDYMVSAAAAMTASWAACAGFYQANISSNSSIISASTGSGLGSQHSQTLRAAGSVADAIAFNTVSGPFTDATGVTISVNTPYVHSSNRGAATIQTWLNNSSNGSTGTTGTPRSGNYNLYLGSQFTTTQPMNGRIYQAVVLAREWTGTERSDTQQFVAAKSGVTL